MRNFKETHDWLLEAEIPVVGTPYWGVIRRCLEPRPQLKSTNQEAEVIWTNKGIALAELERWNEALPCFERALQINPEYAPASGMHSWLLANPMRDH